MATVLIVDDSKTARHYLKSILIKNGYDVIGEARNGLEGHDMYFSLKPDIVTMDVTMPVLDGIATLQKIKQTDPEANIIMLTSNAQAAKMSDAISANAADYILKPIVEKDLLNALERIVNKA